LDRNVDKISKVDGSLLSEQTFGGAFMYLPFRFIYLTDIY